MKKLLLVLSFFLFKEEETLQNYSLYNSFIVKQEENTVVWKFDEDIA